MQRYVDMVCAEIDATARAMRGEGTTQLQTVYFGGGVRQLAN
jgi:coproporphyrinogen III oxidase-like Fe-S oxidoreductase